MRKINEVLDSYNALPTQDNWEQLHENFREAYREVEVYFAENDNTEHSDEMALKEKELIALFNQYHEEKSNDVEKSDTETIKKDEIDMAKKNKKKQAKQVVEEQGLEEETQTTEETTEEQEDEPLEVKEEEQDVEEEEVVEEVVEEEIVESPPAPKLPENIKNFLDFCKTKEVVGSKDFRRFSIDESLWKTGKASFKLGNIQFDKPFQGLIFNSWRVKII